LQQEKQSTFKGGKRESRWVTVKRLNWVKNSKKSSKRWRRPSFPAARKIWPQATGLEPKVISSRVAAMKKTGLVDSPVRCKYGVTKAGREAIS
jgi:hypothetical protein